MHHSQNQLTTDSSHLLAATISGTLRNINIQQIPSDPEKGRMGTFFSVEELLSWQTPGCHRITRMARRIWLCAHANDGRCATGGGFDSGLLDDDDAQDCRNNGRLQEELTQQGPPGHRPRSVATKASAKTTHNRETAAPPVKRV